MKRITFQTLFLVLFAFVTRPLYGQVYPSGTYPPTLYAVPFFDYAGTPPTIGSSGMNYNIGSDQFILSTSAVLMNSGGLTLTNGNLSLISGSLAMPNGSIALGYGGLTMADGTLDISPSGSLDVESGVMLFGGQTLQNIGGSLNWNGVPLSTSLLPTPAVGQSIYYNGASWSPTTNFYNDGTNIGIGTSSISSGLYRLSVEGKMRARGVEVNPDVWSDFVFDKNYNLTRLDTLEQEISQLKHLPGMPGAAEVAKNGVDVGQMDALLLQKIEELTLYIIQQQKEIDALKAQNNNSH